jgi:hypothetical protein
MVPGRARREFEAHGERLAEVGRQMDALLDGPGGPEDPAWHAEMERLVAEVERLNAQARPLAEAMDRRSRWAVRIAWLAMLAMMLVPAVTLWLMWRRARGG